MSGGVQSFNRLVQPSSPIFARHETFHPRFSWLKKGYDHVQPGQHLFGSAHPFGSDSANELGVGKNMASSIRYWSIAFKTIAEKKIAAKKKELSGTSFGDLLLSEKGYDPFLEYSGSLWLLHWSLLKPPCFATTWDFVFNHLRKREFTVEECLADLRDYRQRVYPTARTADSSLRKDINCLLRMYIGSDGGRPVPLEDRINSPFRDLGLIQGTPAGGYAFRFGSKASLPALVIAYACLDFLDLLPEAPRTITFTKLLYDVGSPGIVLKIGESALEEALEVACACAPELQLTQSGGIVQLVLSENIALIKRKLLDNYYGSEAI